MIASSQKPISYDYVIKLKLSRCPSENTNTTFSLNFQLQMFVMRFVSPPTPSFPLWPKSSWHHPTPVRHAHDITEGVAKGGHRYILIMKPNGISAINAEFIMTTPGTWLLLVEKGGLANEGRTDSKGGLGGCERGNITGESGNPSPTPQKTYMCAAGTKWVPSTDSFLFLTPRRKCLSWGGKRYVWAMWMCATGLNSHLLCLFSLFFGCIFVLSR